MTDWDIEAWAQELTGLVREEKKAEEQRLNDLQKKFDKDLQEMATNRDPRDLFPKL